MSAQPSHDDEHEARPGLETWFLVALGLLLGAVSAISLLWSV